jgi:hypothetical protein
MCARAFALCHPTGKQQLSFKVPTAVLSVKDGQPHKLLSSGAEACIFEIIPGGRLGGGVSADSESQNKRYSELTAQHSRQAAPGMLNVHQVVEHTLYEVARMSHLCCQPLHLPRCEPCSPAAWPQVPWPRPPPPQRWAVQLGSCALPWARSSWTSRWGGAGGVATLLLVYLLYRCSQEVGNLKTTWTVGPP